MSVGLKIGRPRPEKSLMAMGDDERAPLHLWMKKTGRGYFRFRCRGFRSRRPSPPPFSSNREYDPGSLQSGSDCFDNSHGN